MAYTNEDQKELCILSKYVKIILFEDNTKTMSSQYSQTAIYAASPSAQNFKNH